MSAYRFPHPVTDITELDAAVQQALSSPTRLIETPQSILVIPADLQLRPPPGRRVKSQSRSMPERTLVLTSDQLIVVARDMLTASIEVTAIPLASMIAFEWGVILLYSWIDIVWADSDLRHTRIEFNTVGEDHLRKLLVALQQSILDHTTPMIDQRTPLTEDQIRVLPMKFTNMLLKRALLPGEHVYTYVFEPALRSRWFWRHRREGLLWAVTNYHSLFIREPPESYPYGVVFTFCPRSKIHKTCIIETRQGVEVYFTLGEPAFEVKGVFSIARQAKLMAAIEQLPAKVDHRSQQFSE
jgi:hypothetical protein